MPRGRIVDGVLSVETRKKIAMRPAERQRNGTRDRSYPERSRTIPVVSLCRHTQCKVIHLIFSQRRHYYRQIEISSKLTDESVKAVATPSFAASLAKRGASLHDLQLLIPSSPRSLRWILSFLSPDLISLSPAIYRGCTRVWSNFYNVSITYANLRDGRWNRVAPTPTGDVTTDLCDTQLTMIFSLTRQCSTALGLS